jgi:hypothetical protein
MKMQQGLVRVTICPGYEPNIHAAVGASHVNSGAISVPLSADRWLLRRTFRDQAGEPPSLEVSGDLSLKKRR